jgi:outer membrane protein TolC
VFEDLTVPTHLITTGRLSLGTKLFGSALLLSTLGCSHERYCWQDSFAERIVPPANSETQPDSKTSNAAQESGVAPEPSQTLTLAEAIDTAFRQQPRLRVYLETVEQARRGEDIAFAPFLPMAVAGYSAGGFDLNVGGNSVPLGPPPGFTFIPALGSIPIGLNINTGYEFADLKLQWLICDFGRRLGRYRQAGLATDIAQLQSERAYQTVANEVAVAYYQVLRTRALRKTAREAVRRAEDDLDVAKKLEKGGVVEKEKRLRVEVQLAESQRLLDAAEGAEAVAVAALNLAIGLNVNAPTSVQESADIPPFRQSLADCLQTAVGLRREFQVARQSIEVADEGRRVAKADFSPRIVAEGSLLDFQQSAPRGHADLAVGFIKLEWGLFEGGKRVAELRVQDSKIRAAMAQAESIADTIAFQVTEAYRNLITAQRGIERARPAVTQAEETYRFVKIRQEKGAALPAEITDAESALTRAQQNYLNSIHDYLIGLARLEYAMGATSAGDGSGSHH